MRGGAGAAAAQAAPRPRRAARARALAPARGSRARAVRVVWFCPPSFFFHFFSQRVARGAASATPCAYPSRETCARLRHQLQLAATLRPAAPRAAAARAASAALPERARSPPHSDASAATTTAAVTERQLLKSLKRASRRAASCHLRELCTDADTLLREGGDAARREAALPELQASLRASLAAAQAAAGAHTSIFCRGHPPQAPHAALLWRLVDSAINTAGGATDAVQAPMSSRRRATR